MEIKTYFFSTYYKLKSLELTQSRVCWQKYIFIVFSTWVVKLEKLRVFAWKLNSIYSTEAELGAIAVVYKVREKWTVLNLGPLPLSSAIFGFGNLSSSSPGSFSQEFEKIWHLDIVWSKAASAKMRTFLPHSSSVVGVFLNVYIYQPLHLGRIWHKVNF